MFGYNRREKSILAQIFTCNFVNRSADGRITARVTVFKGTHIAKYIFFISMR